MASTTPTIMGHLSLPSGEQKSVDEPVVVENSLDYYDALTSALLKAKTEINVTLSKEIVEKKKKETQATSPAKKGSKKVKKIRI